MAILENMKTILTAFLLIFSLNVGHSQGTNMDKKVKKIETFLNNHIPFGHSAVSGYTVKLDDLTLTVETHVYDEESHSRTYNLKEASIDIDKYELEEEVVQFYGFSTYWEVSIDGQWISGELEHEKDAKQIASLLKELIEECN